MNPLPQKEDEVNQREEAGVADDTEHAADRGLDDLSNQLGLPPPRLARQSPSVEQPLLEEEVSGNSSREGPVLGPASTTEVSPPTQLRPAVAPLEDIPQNTERRTSMGSITENSNEEPEWDGLVEQPDENNINNQSILSMATFACCHAAGKTKSGSSKAGTAAHGFGPMLSTHMGQRQRMLAKSQSSSDNGEDEQGSIVAVTHSSWRDVGLQVLLEAVVSQVPLFGGADSAPLCGADVGKLLRARSMLLPPCTFDAPEGQNWEAFVHEVPLQQKRLPTWEVYRLCLETGDDDAGEIQQALLLQTRDSAKTLASAALLEVPGTLELRRADKSLFGLLHCHGDGFRLMNPKKQVRLTIDHSSQRSEWVVKDQQRRVLAVAGATVDGGRSVNLMPATDAGMVVLLFAGIDLLRDEVAMDGVLSHQSIVPAGSVWSFVLPPLSKESLGGCSSSEQILICDSNQGLTLFAASFNHAMDRVVLYTTSGGTSASQPVCSFLERSVDNSILIRNSTQASFAIVEPDVEASRSTNSPCFLLEVAGGKRFLLVSSNPKHNEEFILFLDDQHNRLAAASACRQMVNTRSRKLAPALQVRVESKVDAALVVSALLAKQMYSQQAYLCSELVLPNHEILVVPYLWGIDADSTEEAAITSAFSHEPVVWAWYGSGFDVILAANSGSTIASCRIPPGTDTLEISNARKEVIATLVAGDGIYKILRDGIELIDIVENQATAAVHFQDADGELLAAVECKDFAREVQFEPATDIALVLMAILGLDLLDHLTDTDPDDRVQAMLAPSRQMTEAHSAGQYRTSSMGQGPLNSLVRAEDSPRECRLLVPRLPVSRRNEVVVADGLTQEALLVGQRQIPGLEGLERLVVRKVPSEESESCTKKDSDGVVVCYCETNRSTPGMARLLLPNQEEFATVAFEGGRFKATIAKDADSLVFFQEDMRAGVLRAEDSRGETLAVGAWSAGGDRLVRVRPEVDAAMLVAIVFGADLISQQAGDHKDTLIELTLQRPGGLASKSTLEDGATAEGNEDPFSPRTDASSTGGVEDAQLCPGGFEFAPGEEALVITRCLHGALEDYNANASFSERVYLGDSIVEVNGETSVDSMIGELARASTWQLRVERAPLLCLRLSREASESMGLVLACKKSTRSQPRVSISELQPQGVAVRHNSKEPLRALRAGQRILEVNENRMDIDQMVDAIDNDTNLTLVVRNPEDIPSASMLTTETMKTYHPGEETTSPFSKLVPNLDHQRPVQVARPLRSSKMSSVPESDFLELCFQELSLTSVDHGAFEAQLLSQLKVLGLSEQQAQSLDIRLREGSIIVELRGPNEILSNLQEKPMHNLEVMGSMPRLTKRVVSAGKSASSSNHSSKAPSASAATTRSRQTPAAEAIDVPSRERGPRSKPLRAPPRIRRLSLSEEQQQKSRRSSEKEATPDAQEKVDISKDAEDFDTQALMLLERLEEETTLSQRRGRSPPSQIDIEVSPTNRASPRSKLEKQKASPSPPPAMSQPTTIERQQSVAAAPGSSPPSLAQGRNCTRSCEGAAVANCILQ